MKWDVKPAVIAIARLVMLTVIVPLSAGILIRRMASTFAEKCAKPLADDCSVQAISTASRHPGIAMAIAKADFPDQKLTTAAILLYLIVSAIASAPYLAWRKRHRNEAGPGGPACRNLSLSL